MRGSQLTLNAGRCLTDPRESSWIKCEGETFFLSKYITYKIQTVCIHQMLGAVWSWLMAKVCGLQHSYCTCWGENFTMLISDFTPKTMTRNELNINRSKQQRFDKPNMSYAMQLDSALSANPWSRELKIGKVQPYLQGQPKGMLSNLKDSAWAWIHLFLALLILLCKVTKGKAQEKRITNLIEIIKSFYCTFLTSLSC